MKLEYEDFINQYHPIKQDDDSIFISVNSRIPEDDKNYIWTLVEEDGDLYILSGWHLVNRKEYIKTEFPWEHPDISIYYGEYLTENEAKNKTIKFIEQVMFQNQRELTQEELDLLNDEWDKL